MLIKIELKFICIIRKTMKKASFLLPVIFLFACSKPILLLPYMAEKQSDIKIMILPVEDLTGQYNKEYRVEHTLAVYFKENFKGILINPECFHKTSREAPRYKKTHNPYLFRAVSDFDSVEYTKKEFQPDFYLKSTVEMLDYVQNSPDALGNYLAFGLIGMAKTSYDKRKVLGIVGVRFELINAKTNKVIFQKASFGRSEAEMPDKLSRKDAIALAFKNIPENVSAFLSISEYENVISEKITFKIP
jgi:hypothetical protein